MQHERFFTCDLCGKEFPTRAPVRNDMAITNGEDTRVYADVCDVCVKKLVKVVDDNFPKNAHRKDETVCLLAV